MYSSPHPIHGVSPQGSWHSALAIAISPVRISKFSNGETFDLIFGLHVCRSLPWLSRAAIAFKNVGDNKWPRAKMALVVETLVLASITVKSVLIFDLEESWVGAAKATAWNKVTAKSIRTMKRY